MKVDGHTHTQFCPHGSGEETELFILRAIDLGFDHYCLTEHPPLPETFKRELPYRQEVIDFLAMQEQDLDAYLKEMLRLKEKYKDRLTISVGFELDFLPEHIDWTKHLLNEYGCFLDENILSVHFLIGNDGWRCVDLSPEDYQEGVVGFYSSYDQAQLEYYKVLQEAVTTDLGRYSPQKIGHLNLCQKFQLYFKERDPVLEHDVERKIYEILNHIKEKKWTLDYNFAGLFKPYCKEPYPSDWIAAKAKEMGIPLIYGSDAHKVEEVGRGYDRYLRAK